MNAKIKKVMQELQRFQDEREKAQAAHTEYITATAATVEQVNAELAAATDADSYAAAKRRAQEVETELEFYRRNLKEARQPISAEEYNEKAAIISGVMDDAAAKFKSRADAALMQFVEAYNDLEAIAGEADEAIVFLYELAEMSDDYILNGGKRYRRDDLRFIFLEHVPDPTIMGGYRPDPVRRLMWEVLETLKGWTIQNPRGVYMGH